MTMPTAALQALAAAALFGISTPLAKTLVGSIAPQMLAGLLYAGSGLGLMLVLVIRAVARGGVRGIALPQAREWMWLAGAIVCGGVAGPLALMHGLSTTPASTASLLLNLEAVFTALLAWFAFHENFDRRVVLGMGLIVGAGALLVWAPGRAAPLSGGFAYIAAACLCWAIDNNLTRKVSSGDALVIACMKGFLAGGVNLALAALMGNALPGAQLAIAAMSVGLLGYGISLVLFVVALRHLGTARSGAYFSVAPFFGAIAAVAMQADPVTWQLVAAGILMAAGVWLHLTETHAHEHGHEPLVHTHAHAHDEHHRHAHGAGVATTEPHTHL